MVTSILIILLGVLEIIGFAWILKTSLLSLSTGNITLEVCLWLIVFSLWLSKKISNLNKPSKLALGVDADGKE